MNDPYQRGERAAAYLLPPADICTEVGRIVLAAARLEFEARHFASELRIRPVPAGLKELKTVIKRAAKVLPETDQISSWADRAFELWGIRGRIAHGTWLDAYDESDAEKHVLLSQRGWDELPYEVDQLAAICDEIVASTMEIITIVNRLRDRAIANAPAWGGPFGLPPLILEP